MEIFNPGRPQPDEYLDYFETYIGRVPETEIHPALDSQIAEIQAIGALADGQDDVLHAPYTWTIRQVIGHCLDTERVFGYRAMRFAAGDEISLPGFDQDLFVANTNYANNGLAELIEELVHQRRAHILMFRRMDQEAWYRRGQVDADGLSVRAAAYILVGHLRHHFAIIRERVG